MRLTMAFLALLWVPGCAQEAPENIPSETASSFLASNQAGVPLVTMKHWRDSTPAERYAFLTGFITMLELEKEWQGRAGQGILSFEQSLVPSWVEGFAFRPLTEIYSNLNQHINKYPDELNRPVAEVMWFNLIQPRLAKKNISVP